jgi:dihydroceramide fatty acyl 2-hydroxylase
VTVVASIGLFLAGWAAWTLAEYLLHRFDMHGAGGRGAMAREHRDHHAGRPEVPDRSPRGWVGAALLAAVIGWGIHAAVGAGWIVGFAFYDLQHWAIHARPARGGYGRWIRRHHLRHHDAAPRRNYAVTLPLWDHAFRSVARPQGPSSCQ